jgi:hypothetical protein
LPGYASQKATVAKLIKQETTDKDNRSMAGKALLCTAKYAQLALSAVAGIASIAGAFKQGKSCEEETDASAGKTAETAAEKCTVAANAQLPECICLKNPMLEGCGAIVSKATDNASGGLSALSSVGTGDGSASGLSSGDLMGGKEIADMPQREASSDPAGVGAPMGGGSAGLGGSGGGFGGAGRDPAADDKGKSLNTNILGGTGGGGGGDWGSSGGSGSDKSGYRSFLPGGSKDPLKAAGAQQSWTKEVTGQGGKSNFEKVKDRYNDNKSTLLNN